MPNVLRFGISSLDELLGIGSDPSEKDPQFGIYLPTMQSAGGEEGFATSICLIGPTGTGKSIFGLHMASRYLADCRAAKEQLPSVLYVSTDLTFKMADRAWDNFALKYPYEREDPFNSNHRKTAVPSRNEILLTKCTPASLALDFEAIEQERSNGNAVFVDMASYTAGDDWGFLHKLISLLPAPKDETDPRHLVVVDAIEGFEALAGELNAFGQKSTRRSRIAQVMRLLAGKCHALLVVEESNEYLKDEKLAEEFIADTVIRLDKLSTRNYERRVLTVEKVRGQSHIRGQHHYSIRSGKGSTTGSQVNPDDPEVPAPRENDQQKKQSYVQIFHSVHRLSRRIMEVKNRAREKLQPNTYYAAFGITYLDNMLGGKDESTRRLRDNHEFVGYYYDTRGLPCRSTTALIGDSLTQKRNLGKAFLGRCFHLFEQRLKAIHHRLSESTRTETDAAELWELLSRRVEVLNPSSRPAPASWTNKGKRLAAKGAWQELLEHIRKGGVPDPLPFAPSDSITQKLFHLLSKHQFTNPEGDSAQTPAAFKALTDIWAEAESNSSLTRENWAAFDQELVGLFGQEKLDDWIDKACLTHLATWLLGYQAGVAVMLVTHNTHHEQLAREFTGWLHSREELSALSRTMFGYERALEEHIKGGTICRRLEIHSLSSEVLIHMVQQLTTAAQEKLLTRAEMNSGDLRYRMSWPIRLVIDDFSAFRDIFPELREDPLLLPSLLFHFEREGVTTLIVDTQSGKPDTPIAERFESELRKMVHHNLYTWRVPFYGESRVAITAIPPLSSDYAGIVRELRWEAESLLNESPAHVDEPATVDPHFELYTGLEADNPQPVPLHARFYSETAAMEKFIEVENRFLSERFVFHRHPAATGSPCIIYGMPADGYDDVRDLAYLQRDTRLEHTLLFQVDEFWAMRRPIQHKRAGAFHPQWQYLNAITATPSSLTPKQAEDYQPDANADPYELFQLRSNGDPLPKGSAGTLPVLRRRHFYENYYRDFHGYSAAEFEKDSTEERLIDRVPFSWDFGFLLCQKQAWTTSRHFTVKKKGIEEVHTVRDVWDALQKAEYEAPGEKNPPAGTAEAASKPAKKLGYVSWRVFIEASKKAAEGQGDKLSRPVTAFDFAQISPESFSCLIMEIWLSEIFDSVVNRATKGDRSNGSLGQQTEEERELLALITTVSKRNLFIPASGKNDEDSTHKSELSRPSLAKLVDKYWLELYKSWLLLIEVLNFSEIIGDSTSRNFDFKSKNSDFSAIASRHWYKTASQRPDEAKEPLVAVRLPGHFSVRGDWFLAVSGGSRSIRQAERALDLLSSRRSNVNRLQMGIGLPTRVPLPKEPGKDPGDVSDWKSRLGTLRTKLVSHQPGQDSVDYETFLKIAAPSPGTAPQSELEPDCFYWLWRSGLEDYSHCNRIWHDWLTRTLLWWHRKLLRYRSVWINSFAVYDGLTDNPPPTREDFAPTTRAGLKEIEDEYGQAPPGDEQEKILKRFTEVHHLAQLKVRAGFIQLWKVLKEELEQACREGSEAGK